MKLKNTALLQHNAYINGKFIASDSLKRFPVYNPYNHEKIAEVTDCGIEETKLAIQAAHQSLQSWKQLTGIERGQILRRWYNLMIENLEDLALILTTEQGKTLNEARGEIQYGASYVEWFAEEAKRVYGDTIPGHQSNKRIVITKQPIGVVAAITPWNFPNAMITRKVAPALAAGCTIVVKPPELTPLSALALGVLANEAGIPPGVLNIIATSNSKVVGKELTENSLVKKLSFTGSTPVGKLLMAQCAGTVKKLSLELGGNAPFIVFEDADIDKAVEGAIASKYRNAGQTCVCANRLFVHENIYEEFSEKLSKAVSAFKVGDGTDPEVNIGPLVEEKAIQSVEAIVEDAVAGGAVIKCGGKRYKAQEKTLLYEPTVITEVNKDMQLFTTEIFGPIAPIFKFKTEEEVIELANDTPFGLASYFYGNDHAKIWRVAEALEYGMVGINTGMISTPVAPFGGIKESGMGREGSKYGMDEYLQLKYLCWEI